MQNDLQAGERRRFHRVGFHTDATLKLSVGTISVEVIDISLAGALFKVDSAITVGGRQQGVLTIKLSEEVQIRFNGDLVAHSDGSYAIHRKLSGPEDDHHLRRLLELNLGDPELMERDIETLLADYQQARNSD